MNDDPSQTTKEPTWDSFADEGPTIQEDAFFRARFALPMAAYGPLSGEPDAPLPMMVSSTESRPDGEPVHIAVESNEQREIVDDVGGSQGSASSESVGFETLTSDPIEEIPAVSRGTDVQSQPLAEMARSAETPPDVGAVAVDAVPRISGVESEQQLETASSTMLDTAGQDIDPGFASNEPVDGSAPTTAEQNIYADIDRDAVSRAMVLVALAANEAMKELAEQAQRKEPRPVALVNAETFPEAVEAAFNAPAPSHLTSSPALK